MLTLPTSRREGSGLTFSASVAEFFAGVGLVRQALEPLGFAFVFANDIESKKHSLYKLNFGSSPEFKLGDISNIQGKNVPTVDLATASFPCTDLSLAGHRKGLSGRQSGAFYEFARIMQEMGERRPSVILLENVLGFATSDGGNDLRTVFLRLNQLGYACDVFLLDAKNFVAQSRPRLFVIGRKVETGYSYSLPSVTSVRPAMLINIMRRNSDVTFAPISFTLPPPILPKLHDFVERLKAPDPRWWDSGRLTLFEASLSSLHRARLERLAASPTLRWATAYRRTRKGTATWEIRDDGLAGCLRTTRGGSSRQAILEGSLGRFQVRWMTGIEYARLQGAAAFKFPPERENDALFALGDAVCVPVIRWIGQEYLKLALSSRLQRR